MKLGIQLVCREKQILPLARGLVMRTGGKIIDLYQILIFVQHTAEKLNDVKPIELLPSLCLQPVIEVETIHIYYHPLPIHNFAFNKKPPL